jgi:tetraacyldisaccharide 4'-kinase
MSLWLTRVWAGDWPLLQWLLWPLTLLYRLALWIIKLLARLGLLSQPIAVGKPVVVIGNLTVGGSGKTPLTLWLVEWFTRQGLTVGVLSRGYGGSASVPTWVDTDADPAVVGDEPLLLKRRSHVPVMVSRDRVAGARLLAPLVDVIVCDDGLQHRRLARDVEWLVIDGERRFGNGLLLPAGPCREPLTRLQHVDALICNGGIAQEGEWPMQLKPLNWVRLKDQQALPLTALAGQTVHAFAGMGNPERFFSTLERLKLKLKRHPLPDHAPWPQALLAADPDAIWLMTEKDAIKCPAALAQTRGDNWYYLQVAAELSAEAEAQLTQQCWRLWRAGG